MDCENYQLYFVWKWKFELMDYTKNGGKRREVTVGLELWRISAVDCG